MFLNDRRWCDGGSWISLALLAFAVSTVWSGQNMLLPAAMGLVPPIVMLALWKGRSRTMAVAIRPTEERR